jgi:hypothetical protein
MYLKGKRDYVTVSVDLLVQVSPSLPIGSKLTQGEEEREKKENECHDLLVCLSNNNPK